jgi:hypothetical protein
MVSERVATASFAVIKDATGEASVSCTGQSTGEWAVPGIRRSIARKTYGVAAGFAMTKRTEDD